MHGGPSFTHNYMVPLKLLARKGYPVIFYDQAGCGASFVPKDNSKYPELFTIKYYVEEAHTLVKALNLQDYFVYGSSWGSILAQEFALTQPKGLKAMILDGALCDAQLYGQTQWTEVINDMPQLTLERLRKLEDENQHSSPAYKAIEESLSSQFTVRQRPMPDCFLDCFRTDGPGENKGLNMDIYVKMQGPSEFTIGGVLKYWDISAQLSTVKTPTLILRGQFDTMSRTCSQKIVDSMPEGVAHMVEIPRAAHCKLMDEPQ